MRTLLLVSLLALSFGLTAFSLLAVRFTLNHQIQLDLSSDLQHSVYTYRNFQEQCRQMLARETALLADLPSLKALMTTQDERTIEDAGKRFWIISGGDLFQLYSPAGHLITSFSRGARSQTFSNAELEAETRILIAQPQKARSLAIGDRLYETIAQPLYFGSENGGTLVGYVVLGYAIDGSTALKVGEAAAAEVVFTVNGKVAVSTLSPALEDALSANPVLQRLTPGNFADVKLDQVRYLAAVMPLSPADTQLSGRVTLVVLRSYSEANHLIESINRWLLGLGMLALLLGGLIAVYLSLRVTRPLEALVDGARALGRGDFRYQLPNEGTAEIRELTQAFDHMRLELESSQRALVDSERLATIGRMASSISHDLRHYISAMYANAEFLSLASTPQSEREELIFEVQTAVHGMTDLLDSLLGFSQTGRTLLVSYESLPYLIERAAGLLRAHPETRALDLRLDELPNVETWVDATKFVRVVFNLLLNACQAANRGTDIPRVNLWLIEEEQRITLLIEDNGPGVPESLVKTMFEPFVSRGRENGTGLGLTLAQHIAQEHGGSVQLEESAPGKTVFSLILNKPALMRLRKGLPAAVPATLDQISSRVDERISL